jgi:septum formation protein
MIKLENHQIILGSKSPRRQQLLTDAGFEFKVRTQDDDEVFDDKLPVLEVALSLAYRKASGLKNTLDDNELLITADSVVILDDIIYNKPADYNEGMEMLKKLSGKKHTVATGVALTSTTKQIGFTSITEVFFSEMTEDEIDYYLSRHQPYDKAGAYGIQDWIGLCKVNKIIGSYSNVMGLPMQELYDALRRFA